MGGGSGLVVEKRCSKVSSFFFCKRFSYGIRVLLLLTLILVRCWKLLVEREGGSVLRRGVVVVFAVAHERVDASANNLHAAITGRSCLLCSHEWKLVQRTVGKLISFLVNPKSYEDLFVLRVVFWVKVFEKFSPEGLIPLFLVFAKGVVEPGSSPTIFVYDHATFIYCDLFLGFRSSFISRLDCVVVKEFY